MEFKQRTLMQLADMICGNTKEGKTTPFRYRSCSYLTEFFRDCDTDYAHDGSTRNWWVAETLRKILAEPHPDAATPPSTFSNVIKILMDPSDAIDEGPERPAALIALNVALSRGCFEAFYAADKQCYLRHIATNTIASATPNPHRPFSAAEFKRREQLVSRF